MISNGFEAIHWSKIGDARAPDTEIFEYAAKTQSIIFTNDLDFGTILSKNKTKLPSIIQIRMLDISFAKIGHILVQCLKENVKEFEEGILVTIETNKLRIRYLPIH